MVHGDRNKILDGETCFAVHLAPRCGTRVILCQGKTVEPITRETYVADLVLGGWLKPADVPAVKRATGQTRGRHG